MIVRIVCVALLVAFVAPSAVPQEEPLTTKIYDINDIIRGWQHYPAPAVGDHYRTQIPPVPSGGGALAGSTFNLAGQDEDIFQDPSFIIDIIKKVTEKGEEGWDGETNIEEKSGIFIVTHTEAVQKQVEKALTTIRRMALSPVEIDAKLVRIAPALLAELTAQGHRLDEKAALRLKKGMEDGSIAVVAGGAIRAFPGQRQSLWNGRAIGYTATIDQTPVDGILQPISKTIRSGFVLDITPMPFYEEIRLDIQVSLADVDVGGPFDLGIADLTGGEVSTVTTTIKEPQGEEDTTGNKGEKKTVIIPAKDTTTVTTTDTRRRFHNPRITLPRSVTGAIETTLMTRDRRTTFVGAFSPSVEKPSDEVIALFVTPTIVPYAAGGKTRFGLNGHEPLRIRDVRALTALLKQQFSRQETFVGQFDGYGAELLTSDDIQSLVESRLPNSGWGEGVAAIEAYESSVIFRHAVAMMDAVDREIVALGRQFLKQYRVETKVIALSPEAFRKRAALWEGGRGLTSDEASDLIAAAREGKETAMLAEAEGVSLMKGTMILEQTLQQSVVDGYTERSTPEIGIVHGGFAVRISPVTHDEQEKRIAIRCRPILSRFAEPVKIVEIEKGGRRRHETAVETFAPKFDLLTLAEGEYCVAAVGTGNFAEGKPHLVLLIRADAVKE